MKSVAAGIATDEILPSQGGQINRLHWQCLAYKTVGDHSFFSSQKCSPFVLYIYIYIYIYFF